MKKIFFILILFSLSGCTTKLIYKNLDWLTYWYVDDYIDFTDKQEALFEQHLDAWLIWHKKEELPLYLNHFNELARDINRQQLNADRLTYHQQKFLNHWLRLKTQMIPGLVSIAPLLSESQIVDLFKEIDNTNDKIREEFTENLNKPLKQQKKIALKKRTKMVKSWLGKLNNQQEVLIENTYGQYHANRALWLDYRVRYQISVRALFDRGDKGEIFQTELTELLMFPEVFKENILTQRNNENAAQFKRFLLNLDATLSKKQRQHLVEEISDFSDDIKDITD